MSSAAKKRKGKTPIIPAPKRINLRNLRRDVLVKVRREKQKAFLEFFGTYGTLALACHEVGIREERIHDWRKADPVFDAKFRAAEQRVGDKLVKEVIHRATVGEEKTIYNKQGEAVDTIFEKSDVLLMFATKRHRPEYRDKFEIPAIPVGGPTTNIQNNILVQVDPAKLDGDQLKAYESILLAAAAPSPPVDGGAATGHALPRPAGDSPERPGPVR